MYGHDGKLRQCNEGKYKFDLNEYDHDEWSEFILHVPKYMTTDSLEVNLFPKMVSVRVKGKLTQVKLWEEIDVPETKMQRAITTGKLHITMKKLKSTESLTRLYQKDKEAKESLGKKVDDAKLEDQIETPMMGLIEDVKITPENLKEKIEKQNQLNRMLEEDEEL